MADSISIVDPDNAVGTDYTHLALWEAGEQTTVASGDRVMANCRCTGGTEDTYTTGVNIDGWTVNGRVVIYTEVEYRHRGIYPTSGNIYRLTNSHANDACIQNYENNVTIDGIAMKSNNDSCFEDGVSNGLIVINCYGDGNNYTQRPYNVYCSVAGYVQIMINNFAFHGTFGFACGGVSNAIQHLYNNTAVACSDDLFRTYSQICYIYNNVAQKRAQSGGSGRHYDAYGIVYDDTNHAETTGYSTNVDVNLITGTLPLVNDTTGDLRLTTGDTLVKGKGLDLSENAVYPFDFDAFGQKRGVFWDLGAHQVQRTSYHMTV